jgi:Uma2 family endonuclease
VVAPRLSEIIFLNIYNRRIKNMNETIDFKDEFLQDEELDMGSINHSIAQTKLTSLLDNDDRFATFVELSLDASSIDLSKFSLKARNELVPDVCVYSSPPPEPNKEVEDDILSVSQMPDLAIEVLSPSQSVGYLLRKIKAYFALGVRSCWLVVPSMEAIDVYPQVDQHRTFDMNDTEVIDEIMDIHLPIAKVFKRPSNQKHS